MEHRACIQTMADLMELKLRKHDAERGSAGWMNWSVGHLLKLLMQEVGELTEVAEGGLYYAVDYAAVALEAADVANLAMMVADRLHGLNSSLPKLKEFIDAGTT